MAVNLSAFDKIKKPTATAGQAGSTATASKVDLSAFDNLGKIAAPARGEARNDRNAAPTPPLPPLPTIEPILPPKQAGEGSSPISKKRAEIGQNLGENILKDTILPDVAPSFAPPAPTPAAGKGIKADISKITGKVDLSAFDKLGEDFEKMPVVQKARELGIKAHQIFGEPLKNLAGKFTPAAVQAPDWDPKKYSFKDLGKDTVNFLLMPTEATYRILDSVRQGLGGTDRGSGTLSDLGIGFKDTKLFPQGQLQSYQTEFKEAKKRGLTDTGAALQTAMTMLWDGFVVYGTAKGPALEIARATVRQLPESLLFKIERSGLPVEEIVNTFIGAGKRSPAVENFVKALGKDEARALGRTANAYKKLGLKEITTEVRKPTKLGEFAGLEKKTTTQDLTRKALPPGPGKLPEMRIELLPGSKDAFELAKKVASDIEFKKGLSESDARALAAGGFTAEEFFKKVKEQETPVIIDTSKYTPDSKKVVEAFDKSSNQQPIGQFELGSFGKNAQLRKEGQPDRFNRAELPMTEKYITNSYRASGDPTNYRYDNIAHISEIPNGEKRVIYTRLNSSGKEEIINWHIISDPKFIESLATNGIPTENRTRTLSLERSSSDPLSYRDTSKLSPEEQAVKTQDIQDAEDFQNLIDTIEREMGVAPAPEAGKPSVKSVKEVINEEQFNNMRDLVEAMKTAIEEHPAAGLMKYANKRTMELPEVLGEGGKFGKTGDQIVDELGFEDSEKARASFQDYLKLREEFTKVKKEFSDMRDSIATAKKQGMELKRIQDEVTKALRPKILMLRKYLQGIERGLARGLKLGKTLGRKEMREQLAVKIANKQGNIEEVKREITQLAMQELNLNERGKLLATVKNAKTFEDLADAKEYIKRLQEEAGDREVREKIRNLLADIKPKKDKTGIMRGKFDAESQQTLQQLKDILDMDRGKAQEKLNANMEKYPEMSMMPDSVILENELLQYADLSELKGASLDELYDIVVDIKTTGRTKRQVQIENAKAKIEARQAEFENVLTGGYGLKPGTGIVQVESANELRNTFLDFVAKYDDAHMGGDFLFDKLSKYHQDSSTLQSPMNKWWRQAHEARNTENASIRKATEYIQKQVADIFGLEVKSKEFRDKMIKYMREDREVGRFRAGNGDMITIKTPVNQLIEWWMQFQDQTLIPTYQETMHWTDSMMKAVEDSLTPDEIEIGRRIMNFYNEFRSGGVDGIPLDPLYEKMTGVKLGKIENYSPIRRDAELPNYIQIGEDAMRHASGKPAAIKARTPNAKPIKTVGAFTMLQRHITEMAHYKAFAEFIGEARRTFMGTVNEAVRQYHGSSTLSVINNLVDDLARGGVQRGLTIEWLDTMRGNFAVAATGANPVVFLKQLSSIPAYLSEMPAGAWFGGVAEFWKNPITNAKFLFENSEYMRSRYDFGAYERDIKAAMRRGDNKGLANTENIKEWFTILIRAGDKVAVIQGGWPVYKYNYDRLIREGQSPAEAQKEAIRLFEEATKRTQQAGGIEDLGQIQRSGSLGNLFTLFMTSPIQYYRHITAASRALFGAKLPPGTAIPPGAPSRIRRGPAGESLKRLFIYWVVLPVIFQWISDGFDARPRRLGRAALLGGFTYPVVLGELATSLGNAFFGLPVFSGGGTPAPFTTLTELAKTAESIVKKTSNGISGEDLFSAIADLASIAGKGFGVPVDPILRTATGAYDITTGKTADPRRLVYSQFMLGDQGAEKKDNKKKNAFGLPELPKLPSLPKLPKLPSLPRF